MNLAIWQKVWFWLSGKYWIWHNLTPFDSDSVVNLASSMNLASCSNLASSVSLAYCLNLAKSRSNKLSWRQTTTTEQNQNQSRFKWYTESDQSPNESGNLKCQIQKTIGRCVGEVDLASGRQIVRFSIKNLVINIAAVVRWSGSSWTYLYNFWHFSKSHPFPQRFPTEIARRT